MDKHYSTLEKESFWYHQWLKHDIFRQAHLRPHTEAFSIMLPPPNVTGSLHMGHAFQDSVIDILVRHAAQNGKKTLWQVGTDHAGIATQMVVTRLLAQQGIDSRSLSRQEFLDKIWAWKEESGGTILSQLKRLGVFIDWERERFTLDEPYTKAVQHAFVQLYRDNLIYKSHRLVNWDCHLQSAVSDLEVDTTLEDNPLYTLRYQVVGTDESLELSTTRPETLFGDLAVAVHPDDVRYSHLIGKQVALPLTTRAIPIIADQRVDKDFGTGVVKITPAHDFFDFKIGQDHQLGFINILDKDGRLNAQAGAFEGQDRLKARPAIVQALKENGALVNIEPHQSSIPRAKSSGAIIEPYITEQWYVAMRSLADKALAAYHSGAIRFTPENWGANYQQWLENIEDWCISRQLVWGHQIPAWVDDQGTIYVGYNEQEVRDFYQLPSDLALTQDPDVLDTWFSSALWPFATLGWPESDWEQTPYFPNSVLVTGFDIIFFWVARMAMFSLYFTGKVPFHTVYIHGLIQDADGVKMSKSKGNVIDPIDIIDGISLEALLKKRTHGLMQPEMRDMIVQKTKKDYPQGFQSHGVDPLRLAFALQATPTRFMRFDIQRVTYAQNVCHKLWNLVRFSLPYLTSEPLNKAPEHLLNRWVLQTLHDLNAQCQDYLETQYRFDLYSQNLVDVMWSQICDRYVEYAKILLKDPQAARETGQTLTAVVRTLLGLMHPVIPFITEELNATVLKELNVPPQMLVEIPPCSLLPPVPDLAFEQQEQRDSAFIVDFIKEVRRVRSSLDVPPKEQTFVMLDAELLKKTQELHFDNILSGLAQTTFLLNQEQPAHYKGVGASLDGHKIMVFVPSLFLEKRATRLQEEMARCVVKIEKTQQRLDNTEFCQNAPAAVLQKERQRLAELLTEQQALAESLSLLS